ncbi:MAG: MATE family efflux transporter [Clostridia bacterium]|nr:MATE family efflux transporter [Clostridia bacterium]
MSIRLSDHFSYGRLIRFTLPSVAMMVFSSVYGVVDGFFVSNYVGKTPFAAVNFIMPFLMVLGTFGFMFGTGGSALVSKTLGEGDEKKARSLFSLITLVSFLLGVAVAALGLVFLRPVAALLGAEGELLEYCVTYGNIILLALPFFMLQMEFQSFFIATERPKLGLYSTVFAGVANMVLDYVLVGLLPLGIVGAALATAISQLVGGVFPLVYFFLDRKGLLYFSRPRFDLKALVKTCTNGSSELMSNVSMSLVGMLYNVQLMQYAGENGVAAYGVLMYLSMIFIGIFIGYSLGTAPVFSYHFGAENRTELKSLLKKSVVIVGILSLGMLILGEILARPLSLLFVGYDPTLLALTHRGFVIFSFSFPFAGFAIFASGFFTALNNGPVSAVISFLRTLVFQIGAILLLPLVFGVDGIWYSIVLAEAMATLVSLGFLAVLKKGYGY